VLIHHVEVLDSMLVFFFYPPYMKESLDEAVEISKILEIVDDNVLDLEIGYIVSH
jgi:hypothetical protein